MTSSTDDAKNIMDCGASVVGSIAGKSVFESSTSHDSSIRPDQYSAPVVGKKEQKFVFLSKVLVAIVLTLAVCALATTAYTLVTEEEKNNFESQV